MPIAVREVEAATEGVEQGRRRALVPAPGSSTANGAITITGTGCLGSFLAAVSGTFWKETEPLASV